MAKVKFSALVSEMRNKLNGSVFSKNRAGNYLRNKTTPVNPQTGFQQARRSTFGSISSAWRGLTDSQRKSWIELAQQLVYTDIFGDTKVLSGSQLHQKLNTNIMLTGNPIIATAPVPVSVPFVGIVAATVTAGTPAFTVTVSPGTVPAGFTLLVYATPLISPGRAFVKNEYRLLGPSTPTAGVVDLLSSWNFRFGSLVEGQKIFVRVVLVSEDTGQAGIASEVAITVAA